MARETVEDWVQLGADEPWWGVLSAPQFLSADLTEEAKEQFYQQGREEIEWALAKIRQSDPKFRATRALDFGSGLGRLSFAMAPHCDEVLGVDVSPGMLAEAERQRVSRGFSGVSFASSIPEGAKFNWANSYIVFQHILPRTGYAIIEDILDHLERGAWTSLQMTFAHDRRDVTSFIRDASALRYDGEVATVLEFNDTNTGEMSMYDYDMNKVLFIFTKNGFSDLRFVHTDHGGAHGFWIFAKKQ